MERGVEQRPRFGRLQCQRRRSIRQSAIVEIFTRRLLESTGSRIHIDSVQSFHQGRHGSARLRTLGRPPAIPPLP